VIGHTGGRSRQTVAPKAGPWLSPQVVNAERWQRLLDRHGIASLAVILNGGQDYASRGFTCAWATGVLTDKGTFGGPIGLRCGAHDR